MFKQNYYAQKSASHDFYGENKVNNNEVMSSYYAGLEAKHREDYYKTVGLNNEEDCYTGCQIELNYNNVAVSM
ncbi:hypothetical protein [Halanaerobacter jeridensis]|uniref:Uncharacterized protein n=1 Tax=Halanaerobacter jeridensis TaxID=706427 RepID=A0A938XWT8_9FIRM|nr:hypothetical protein [Halanaerobacter jeridensis]MBM7556740.1 hypothetical protein [Halanaerobacter jeridensis]